MGLFDLICPPRVPPSVAGNQPVAPTAPTEETCRNCHTEVPEARECPSFPDWPSSLVSPIESISRNPDGLRWWVDENHLRTALRRLSREELFPFEVGAHSLRIEVDPNEREIGSWFLSGSTRLNVNLRGQGVMLYLDSNPLAEASDISLIGGLRVFFDRDGWLTSNSVLLNYFSPLPSTILAELPVAYDAETGTLYNYTDYTRRVLIENQCGSPIVISGTPGVGLDGGIPPPLGPEERGLDGGNTIDLPEDIIRQMRNSAPNLGTGYADAGCGYFEALPTRLPYLFEFAHALATGHSEASRLDLLRLYQDLRTLGRLGSRPSPSREFNPFSSIDRARVVWRLSPERLAFQNFLMEFAASTAEHPLTLTLIAGNSGLRTIEIDDRISLSQLYVPGAIHLGETSFRLHGTGPHLNVRLDGIQSEVLPFDLGQDDPSDRGFLHVVGGNLSDGEAFSEEDLQFPSGLSVTGDLDHSLLASLNLQFDLTVEIPGGGQWDLSGQLLAQTRLARSESGFEPEVGSTWIRLQGISLRPHREGVDPSSIPAFLENVSLTATDRLRAEETRSGFRVSYDFSGGAIPFFRAGHGEVLIPVRAYDPSDESYHHERPASPESSHWVYRPDQGMSDFSTDFQFGFSGRRGVPDLNGDFRFQTAADEGRRTYEAMLNFSPLGIPLGGRLLYLNPLQIHFQAHQEQNEEGICHFEVPIFEILGRSSGRGLLQGGARIYQANHPHRPLSAAYDPSLHRLDVENVDLRFLFRRIVIPALVRASREDPSLPPQITGLDLDGRFRGHWTTNTESGRGHGNLCLVGDSADVSLRGADGRILPDPLVSDTRWCASSVYRTDTHRQIVWGNFFLDTTFDWGLLRYLGIHLNMRQRMRMAHDNLPYSPRGYDSVERVFFRRVREEGRGSRERSEAP